MQERAPKDFEWYYDGLVGAYDADHPMPIDLPEDAAREVWLALERRWFAHWVCRLLAAGDSLLGDVPDYLCANTGEWEGFLSYAVGMYIDSGFDMSGYEVIEDAAAAWLADRMTEA